MTTAKMPVWAWAIPAIAWVLMGVATVLPPNATLVAPEALALIATVFAAVFHAELVAHRVGEPFGTLVLAVAVTVIEVALIVSVMLGGGPGAGTLARDTVFAAVMLVCNGIVGMCLLAGGVRYHEQGFQLQGANAALAVLAALTTLSLVLPNFTTSAVGPFYTATQMVFAGVASLVLYGAFVFIQTVRHRNYFLAPQSRDGDEHAQPPSASQALASAALLLVSLVGVILLAKKLTPPLESGLDMLGAPKAVVGVVIAAVVLLPEGLAALRAAQANRLQTSMNLALGSSLATIGLTIPAVVATSLLFHLPVTFGLEGKEEVLLALTLLVALMTLGTGRTTVLQGMVHLVILAAFLFFAVVP